MYCLLNKADYFYLGIEIRQAYITYEIKKTILFSEPNEIDMSILLQN